jgi:hypothetical protein
MEDKLCTSGNQKIETKILDSEVKTVKELLEEFPNLEPSLDLTNHVIRTHDHFAASCCWMCPTRVDAILAKYQAQEHDLGLDQSISRSNPNDLDEVAKLVSESIHTKTASVGTQPSLDEDEEDIYSTDVHRQALTLDIEDAAE